MIVEHDTHHDACGILSVYSTVNTLITHTPRSQLQGLGLRWYGIQEILRGMGYKGVDCIRKSRRYLTSLTFCCIYQHPRPASFDPKHAQVYYYEQCMLTQM